MNFLFLNNRDKCLVCLKPPEQGFELIKHHVSYFPETCCYVHYECHKKIHDGERSDLIQFEEGDSKKFYDLNKRENSE